MKLDTSIIESWVNLSVERKFIIDRSTKEARFGRFNLEVPFDELNIEPIDSIDDIDSCVFYGKYEVPGYSQEVAWKALAYNVKNDKVVFEVEQTH